MRKYCPMVAAQFAGNALLMALAYYWLGTGEGSAARLVWSLLVAAAIVCLACWLHGAAFIYFAAEKPVLAVSFRAALRRVAPLLAAVILIGLVYLLLSKWASFSGKPAFQIASWLTLKFRKPVRPASVLRVFNVVLWLVRWMVVPVLALPIVARIASGRKFVRRPWYWVAVPVLLVVAFWVPFVIWGWVPHVPGFGWEMASFAARAVIGYSCFLAGWLAVAWLSSADYRSAN